MGINAEKERSGTPHRVLVTKLGLDGHDRGARIVARVLRDAGFEVIYGGLRQTAASITTIAVEEDVELIGVSILSGAHVALVPELIDSLHAAGVDIPVIVGGLIPVDDRTTLEQHGTAAVFGPEMSAAEIVGAFRQRLGG